MTGPVTRDALYVITWTDAHGDSHDSRRHGNAAAEFIAALFTTPGCRLIAVVLG